MLKDKILKNEIQGYKITDAGFIKLKQEGYNNKLNKIAIAISVLATTISLFALFISKNEWMVIFPIVLFFYIMNMCNKELY